ncbi:VC0807 family protein [Nocardia sp. NPDC050799]|uniref:VC0807 family protein n=1 Tax=Nocardia sp. NPDC050799 TaxID=3154842 RepID=UPI003410BD81
MTPSPERDPRRELISLGLDAALPLALFYGLRMAGIDQWLALVISGAVPILRIGHTLARRRRVNRVTLFTLSMLLCGTAVGLLTSDPRLLLARESYITALIGLWMLGSLLGRHPFILTTMLAMLPPSSAQSWRDNWEKEPAFRRVMRIMTAAWGCAFVIDAVSRVVMAYTLPVDSVPLLSALLLVVMLVIVVQWSKSYGRRLQRRHAGHRPSPN